MAPGDSTVVDLDRPETVAPASAGVDLVVDPVPHPGLTAERVVLREGGARIDVSMRPAAAARRLRAETTSPWHRRAERRQDPRREQPRGCEAARGASRR
jgi:hypothetical protein